jgi:hypothetical protein
MGELGELAVDREVPRAGASPEQERLAREMSLERLQEPAVARLDDRSGHGVRAHNAQAADLALADGPGDLSQGLVGNGVVAPGGQDDRGFVDVVLVGPAVVEHGLGQPFVGVILDQLVDKGEARIVRDQAASGIVTFQPANESQRNRPLLYSDQHTDKEKGGQ